MNLASLDLNLLVALDALLLEANVGRAAMRIGLSQPAASHALRRLRDVLGDPLLVRTGARMELTPRAQALRAPLAQALDQVRGLFMPDEFDAARSERRFRLMMPDLAVELLMPPLMKKLDAVAPGVRIDVVPWRGPAIFTAEFARTIDMVISIGDAFKGFHRQLLYTDSDALAVRRGHPAGARLKNKETFFKARHVAVIIRGQSEDLIDTWLRSKSQERRIALVVPSYIEALHVAARTDLVAFMPRRLIAALSKQLSLTTVAPPLDPGIDEQFMFYPTRAQMDPGSIWLRTMMLGIGKSLGRIDGKAPRQSHTFSQLHPHRFPCHDAGQSQELIMTVLIAGGGIGGLTLALSLHQIGIPCRVFESVPELKPLGVGINVLPHAVRELIELGLLEKLDAAGVRTKELSYFSKHGKPIWSEPRGIEAGYKWPQFSIHRGTLHQILLDTVVERLGADNLLNSHHVTSFTDSPEGVSANFIDKATGKDVGTYDGSLLIAADGIHSAIRARLYPDEGPPIWNGRILWRGITESDAFLSGRTMIMAGHEVLKFVCYPISNAPLPNGKFRINWIAERLLPPTYSWRREDYNRAAKLDEFLPWFEDWTFDWLDVPGLIRNCAHAYEYPLVDRDPIDRWTFGNITLLGDAAHPMYPIGSNGASQAILDARVLTREILKHGETATALQAYEAERRPATTELVKLNRRNGPEQVMQLVEERAPNGFNVVTEVMSQQELEDVANTYKRVAGFQVDALNAKPPIVPKPETSFLSSAG